MKNRNIDSKESSTCGVALLLIDVINDLNFPEANQLLRYAEPMAERIMELKKRCKQMSIPAIYVNDNFGVWRSDFRKVLTHCLRVESKGRLISKLLEPDEDDYFVLKPKHSGFHCTTLDLLLAHLQIHSLIITGIAGNICVLFTANDAYMRDFNLIIPRDCIASNSESENSYALALMQKILKADTTQSKDLQLAKFTLAPTGWQSQTVVGQFGREG